MNYFFAHKGDVMVGGSPVLVGAQDAASSHARNAFGSDAQIKWITPTQGYLVGNTMVKFVIENHEVLCHDGIPHI